jgi:hypothetical protein
MKFCNEVMALKVTSMPYFLYLSFNHSKMADVHISELNAIHSRVSLPQQWITIGKIIADVHMENEDTWFAVEQKRYKGIVGLKHEVRWCKNGNLVM